MASARFRMGHAALVTGPWTWGAYDTALSCTASEFVKVELESTAGVDSIAVTIPTGDPTQIAATLPAVTVNQSTKTATFQLPAVASTVNVCVTVNNGALNGVAQTTYTSTLQAYVPTAAGHVLLAVGETDQYSRAYGHTGKLNAAISVATLPAGAAGKMIYYNGAWTTLAIGAQYKVLESSGAAPQWSYPTTLRDSAGASVVATDTGSKLGFYGTAPVVRQNVTLTAGGAEASLHALLDALALMGLITTDHDPP